MTIRPSRAAEGGPSEAKASAAGPLMAFQSLGRAVWSARDWVSLTRQGYELNVVGFRAVRMVADAAAAIPLTLCDCAERQLEHPILRLLARPNPVQDGASLLEVLYSHLQLTGNAYLEGAAHDAMGLPRELHALRPDRMTLVPGPDGWPMAYDYTVGRAKHRFEMTGAIKPILHLKTFHPLDDHYGMSPMEAAAQSVDVHNAAQRWTKSLLDNAARPSGAIVFANKEGGTHLSAEQYERLVRELEDNHQGARNAGRPLLLEGGLDWRPMGYSPEDMQFQETKAAAAREIALAFGVPPQLLGLPGDNTYSNYQEANRAFYRQTVLPLVRKTAAAIGNWLSDGVPGDIRLDPDLDQIPALGTEREAMWRRISEASFLDDDEKRQMLGLAPRVATAAGT